MANNAGLKNPTLPCEIHAYPSLYPSLSHRVPGVSLYPSLSHTYPIQFPAFPDGSLPRIKPSMPSVIPVYPSEFPVVTANWDIFW